MYNRNSLSARHLKHTTSSSLKIIVQTNKQTLIPEEPHTEMECLTGIHRLQTTSKAAPSYITFKVTTLAANSSLIMKQSNGSHSFCQHSVDGHFTVTASFHSKEEQNFNLNKHLLVPGAGARTLNNYLGFSGIIYSIMNR